MTLDPGQLQPDDAPATAPAAITAAEIQKIVEAEAQRIVSERIPGLQAVYEKQIASLRKELKKAQADPDGYVDTTSSELEAEIAKVRRENEALRIGRQYPDIYPVYEALLGASSVEDQLELLQAAVRGVQAPAQPPAPAPQETVQAPPAPAGLPVDPNRPLEGTPRGDAEAMNKAYADSIINAMHSWPTFN